jgi:hypothetical protein
VLAQLTAHDSDVRRPVVDLYLKCHQTFPTRSPTVVELRNVTREILVEISRDDKIYLIIDALDEVAWGSLREDLLQFVCQLPELALEKLCVLVSSRNENDFKDSFGHTDTVWQSIPVGPGNVNPDIESYINNSIERYPSLRRQNSCTKELIREKLIRNANGMYVVLCRSQENGC